MSVARAKTARSGVSRTSTSTFGVGRRENHDSHAFYERKLTVVHESTAVDVKTSRMLDDIFVHSAEEMSELEDNSVALMVTSPPYHVGKDYDSDSSFDEYLDMLENVFAETYRKLQPGGRAVVNVANLGRRPYVPLSHLVTERMLKIGYLMRAEIIWRKAKGASGSCAWGSWQSPANPVIRDVHEYCLCFSKGRFDRVVKGTPTMTKDDFLDSTLSIWEIAPESAKRVKHPAPFPVELPGRFIDLYTFEDELVLDPFIGSGSTAVAAIQRNRHWIGYELSEEYAEIARKRVAAAEAELSVK